MQITYPLKNLRISKDLLLKPFKVKGLIFKIFEVPLKFKGNRSLTSEVPLNIKILSLLRSDSWHSYHALIVGFIQKAFTVPEISEFEYFSREPNLIWKKTFKNGSHQQLSNTESRPFCTFLQKFTFFHSSLLPTLFF